MINMYGKANTIEDVLEFLLEQFSLEEILELNDITELELLEHLYQEGLLTQPERAFERNDNV